jgi:hydroxymethylglutaryl-CoA reductase
MSHVKLLPVKRSAKLSGFYRLSPAERRARLVESRWLSPEDAASLAGSPGLDEAGADAMVENSIGLHALPLAVATGFHVNGEERLIPMAVEEPSIVAACSHAAKLAGEGGGFFAQADPPLVAAQVELRDVPDLPHAVAALEAHEAELLATANSLAPRMVGRGGGSVELQVRVLGSGALCVHVLVDCRDAMGANTVNAIAEGLSARLCELARARPGLRILTNLADRRKVYVRVKVPVVALASDRFPDGAFVRDAIIEAQRFAELDVYRAVTHNKGIMNGVDAVLLACGNDWRAVEAGAHAYAARSGRYQPLSSWKVGEDGALEGELVMPLSASTVGGATRSHAGVRRSLRLAGAKGALDLAMLAGAAGLASNLAALKALATEGIQRGHMALHARRVAAEAGAEGALIELVAAQLSAEKSYRPERASELLGQLRKAGA